MTPAPPDCPRCGYDQTGAVAAWTDRCPLRGRCAECGLDFRWLDILRPEHDTPLWFVERRRLGRNHAILGLVARALRTWWRVLLPWRFWGRIRLHLRVRWLGLAVWLPMVLLVFSLPADVVAGYGLLDAARLGFVPGGFNLARAAFDLACEPFVYPSFVLGDSWTPGPCPPGLLVLYTATALWPAAVCLAPTTLGRAKVAPRHLIRATVYSLAWLPVWVGFSTVDTLAHAAGGIMFRSRMPLPGWARHLAWEGLGVTSRWFAIATIAGLVWLGIYWACALQIGFQMRRGWAVAAGAGVVVTLTLYGLMMAWEVTGWVPSSRLAW